ncbi:MAG TPA: GGDEF domain-containing protein, partial [Candidatus Dormibacteraeota bacterium]|nr:GGDEF domain-containing protein [Candidatus Dormibacteraeota bacterium]
DSLLSDRPYRLALSLEDVTAQLLEERDRCWARSLVDAAVAELREFGPQLAAATPSAQSAVTHLGGQAVETIALSLAALDRRLHELDRQVNTDDLTGVLRRGAGISRLEAAIAETRRQRRPLSLVFVDVDGLKGTNDSSGHAVGDTVLLNVASTLTDAITPDGFVFRYGGDEFVCVMPDRSEAETAALFETVQANYAQQFGGSFSAGFAGLNAEESGSDLIGRADLDLYNRRRFAALYVIRPKDAAHNDPDSAKRAI